MRAGTGGRLRPPPARDSRGRFCSPHAAAVQQQELPPSEEVLLWHFDLKGWCSFPDPWREGRYVIETRKSLKGFPVAMRYDGPVTELAELDGYGCVIKYDSATFGERWPAGEVAVSPVPWYGSPLEGWGEGSWESELPESKRQLAQLYIHLAHSIDLHLKSCGDQIGITRGYY